MARTPRPQFVYQPSAGPRFRLTLLRLDDRITPAVFDTRQVFAAAPEPDTVAIADFNGDGRPDLATATLLGEFGHPDLIPRNVHGVVTVRLNTTPVAGAPPAFGAAQTFAVGYGLWRIAATDLNSDGRADLVLLNTGDAQAMTVLLNTTPAGVADASFAAPQSVSLPNFGLGLITGLAFADFDGDGRIDIGSDNGNMTVFRNTTPVGGQVVTLETVPGFLYGVGHGVGDLDGDGRIDILSNDGYHLFVHRNTTPSGSEVPGFTRETFALPSVGEWTFQTAADFNGDDRLDVVLFNQYAGTVAVLLNATPAGSALAFAAPQTIHVGEILWGVVVGDFDGDGRPDLAANDLRNGSVAVLLNTTDAGAGAVAFTAPEAYATGTYSRSAAVGDLNGDGSDDLAIANLAEETVLVLSNSVAWTPPSEDPTDAAPPAAPNQLETPAILGLDPGGEDGAATEGAGVPDDEVVVVGPRRTGGRRTEPVTQLGSPFAQVAGFEAVLGAATASESAGHRASGNTSRFDDTTVSGPPSSAASRPTAGRELPTPIEPFADAFAPLGWDWPATLNPYSGWQRLTTETA